MQAQKSNHGKSAAEKISYSSSVKREKGSDQFGDIRDKKEVLTI